MDCNGLRELNNTFSWVISPEKYKTTLLVVYWAVFIFVYIIGFWSVETENKMIKDQNVHCVGELQILVWFSPSSILALQLAIWSDVELWNWITPCYMLLSVSTHILYFNFLVDLTFPIRVDPLSFKAMVERQVFHGMRVQIVVEYSSTPHPHFWLLRFLLFWIYRI